MIIRVGMMMRSYGRLDEGVYWPLWSLFPGAAWLGTLARALGIAEPVLKMSRLNLCISLMQTGILPQ